MRLKVVCVSDAPVDRERGFECVRANIKISCKTMESDAPSVEDIWSPVHVRSFTMNRTDDRDWIVNLRAFAKGETRKRPLNYALVVVVEDPLGNDIRGPVRDSGRYPDYIPARNRVSSGTERVVRKVELF